MQINFHPLITLQQYKNQCLRSHQDIASNFLSELFGLDFCPIIEGVHAFNVQLSPPLAPFGQTDADRADGSLESSTTSYGELLYEKVCSI